ncbi:nitrate reductase [Vibrio diabolicus]|uniref:Nitrite reductase n=1 Tax=Vibrio diabolicus TaxID=50719 RepID=A0AAX1XPY6_9VIBR|nr:nitrate reductase [Vibrio diabolicus]MCS0346401.1 molybdopterin-dependent oxidoreductase [Vibrio diabolicus]MCS0361442.1 molybdopterin-dependent oxidoreductase [Vibrio diabolicus]MCS0376488.1 molybdopterin-dependent oxidoreductase [Vibrio diabolicus]MCS0425917.1 molybdopterin-dependent oxidoreductase [Vibrio diabolicus]MCS0442493.1 molybdopterin-dependent oxidoreductase [Vibrio diabolicus]
MSQGCRKTTCPYCGVGCGIEISNNKIIGDALHPANSGSLCVKGVALAESLKMPSRLLYPKLREKEVSWQSVTDLIAQEIHQAKAEFGPDSVAMYVSGQLLTEDYYVANKLMKGYVGSANIDTNSRLCMSSAVAAHVRAFGEDVVPVNYDDIDNTELLVICGANTAWTHPVLFRRIQQARENNPNLKLVVIDPRETVTAQQADLHLPIKNDGDVSLFNGLIKFLIEQQCIDSEYINSYTESFSALAEEVSDLRYDVTNLTSSIGISEEKLTTFFQWFAQSPTAITLFCQGVNQAENGVDKGNAIINAHLASGKIAKSGCGPFSITGQPNAMGGREVGGLANQLAVHRAFDSESIKQVQAFWDSPEIATKPGLKAVELFEAVERGEIKVLWIMATNPVVSLPDNQMVKRALEACPFVIVSDITAESDVAKYADVLLPAAGWGEKQGMVTNSERRMSRQRQFQVPPGEAKPDWWAISQVGQALCALEKTQNGFAFASERAVFREYAAMTGMNADSPLKLDLSQHANLTEQEYEEWVPTQWGGERPFADGIYSHPDGKARFVVTSELPQRLERTKGWWLNTGRQRDQWHTMTRTGHIAHLAASELEPTVYMNTLSATQNRLKAGQLTKLFQPTSNTSIYAKVAIDEGLGFQDLFMSMHWAGRYGGESSVNAIINSAKDPISGQPAFKSSYVEVQDAAVKTYGMFIGTQFDSGKFLYSAFQAESNLGIWRFAHDKRPKKQSFCRTEKSRRITIDIAQGWLAVDYDLVGDVRIIRSVLVVSSEPIQTDYTNFTHLIGKPMELSQLLTITQSQSSAKLVCSCFRVTDKQIHDAMEKQDCTSLTQLQNKLKCGTNCGSCVSQIKQMVDSHQHQKGKQQASQQSLAMQIK